jgi:hypothetical protein
MPQHYEVQPPPPIIRLRDISRLLMLVVLAMLLIALFFRAADPRAWQWVKTFGRQPEGEKRPTEELETIPPAPPLSFVERLRLEMNGGQAASFLAAFMTPTLVPSSVDAALACPLHLEHVPLPPYVDPRAAKETRRTPLPLPEILGGAWDRRGFELDNAIVSRENPDNLLNERKRMDADARYHLLQLAHGTTLESLRADARTDVPYPALLQNPDAYRGEIIHLEGDLLAIEHFVLSRKIPGLDRAYFGDMTVVESGRKYGILLTELPADFPPEREWSKLYRHGVKFDGYFLKVLMMDHPRDKDRVLYIPVLVGKTVELPPAPLESGWSIPILPTVAIGLGVIVIVLLAGYFYRRSEYAHARRMAAIRQQARAAVEGAPLSEIPLARPALPDRNGSPFPSFSDPEPPAEGGDTAGSPQDGRE